MCSWQAVIRRDGRGGKRGKAGGDWGGAFDQDPAQAVTTRRKVYDMLVADKTLVQGFHYPFPGVARVEKAEGGYRVAPAAWSPSL